MKKIEFELDDSVYNEILDVVKDETKVAEYCKTATLGKIYLRKAMLGVMSSKNKEYTTTDDIFGVEDN